MIRALRIEGRGPVAMALQLMLRRQGFRACDIDADPLPDPLPEWLASRALALSLGSLQLLGRIVPGLGSDQICQPPAHAAAITQVDISRRGALGSTCIDAHDQRVPMLGAVIRYGNLHRLLREALEQSTGAEALILPNASLTIMADGDPGQAGQANARDFNQQALLAEVFVSHDQPGCAFERFTPEGPLALLPLPEAGRRALVWCAPEATARARAELSEEDFCSQLHEAFGPLLGRFTLASTRHVSAVGRRWRDPRLGPHRVAIGNAAQSLHPVAGQGLNLGLRDALVLAQCLGQARATSATAEQTLERYARLRKPDQLALVTLTDALASLTCSNALQPLQSSALLAIDLIAPLRHAMGAFFMRGVRRV